MKALRLFFWGLLAVMVVPNLLHAQDPGIPDTVRVAKVATNAGLDVGVPVTIFNDENIGGYSLGFSWSTSDVFFDSVSYIGTRLPDPVQRTLTVNNPLRRICVGMIDIFATDPLTPGAGVVFTLWFSVAPAAPDQFVPIDSVFFPPACTFTLAPSAGGEMTPQFRKGEIKIGNPPPPPVIVLSQHSFVFNAEIGGGNPTSQVLNITNGGGQTLNWTATWAAPWVGVNPSFGTAPSVVVITANTTGLPAGTYNGKVYVSAPGATNTPDSFTVTLNLTIPPPIISLVPDSFYFACLQSGPNPPTQNLSITNTGLGTLNWTAVETAPWLNLSSYSGTAPSIVTVSVDNTSLPFGLYIDSIRISDPTATNTPQYAKVVFEIFSEFPVILPNPDTFFVVGSGLLDPYDRLLEVKNNGGGTMNWHVTKTKPWLSFDIDTGSATQSNPGEVMLSFNRTLIDFGLQFDTVTITSSNAINSPVKVPVTFWKMEVPQNLNVSPTSLSFTEVECGVYLGIPARTINITAAVSTPLLNWTATHTQPWLVVKPSAGLHGAVVRCSVLVEGLTPAVYHDTVVVSSDVSLTPPKKVPVTFTVTPTAGTPGIGLSDDSLAYFFKYTQVGTADQSITVFNVPGGCLDWQATSTVPWLTPIPSSGTTISQVKIRSDAVGLPRCRNFGRVIFTSTSAPPETLDVSLWIYTFGDANCDGIINITDVVYILQYIFSGGPAPLPFFWVGDVNCDRITNITDIVHLVNWIFNEGAPPCLY